MVASFVFVNNISSGFFMTQSFIVLMALIAALFFFNRLQYLKSTD